jgi:hypothetical protein
MDQHDTQEPDQEEQRYEEHRNGAQDCLVLAADADADIVVHGMLAAGQLHAVLAQAAATMAVVAELKALRAALAADRPSPAAEQVQFVDRWRCTWLSGSGWRCPLTAGHELAGLPMHTINFDEPPAVLAMYEQANGRPWAPGERGDRP